MYQIRHLEAADAEEYRRLRLDSLQLHPEAYGSSFEEESLMSTADLIRRALSPPGGMIGAFADGRLAGMAGLFVQRRPKQRHKGELVQVYVDAAHRRSGIARELVVRVIGFSRDLKLRVLHLHVTVGNESARGLYLRLGFHPCGVARRSLLVNGRLLDEEIMAMDLD
jgi:RimJ/RimL family protein N-acetyltransferase